MVEISVNGNVPGCRRRTEPEGHRRRWRGRRQAFEGFALGGFIRIGRDGSITFVIPNPEKGQGIYSGEAKLIAESLNVGLDQVKVVPAPPNEELYRQPILKSQATGGSTSIRGAWMPLRQVGAAAPTRLIAAAAAEWTVPPEEQGQDSLGQHVFENACASCHAWSGNGQQTPYAALRGSQTVNDPTGTNLVQVILHGSQMTTAQGSAFMPAFAGAFSDVEIAALSNYVLQHFGNKQGKVTAEGVANARKLAE